MPTFEVNTYIGYRGISLTNFSLLMSLATIDELDVALGLVSEGVFTSPGYNPPLDELLNREISYPVSWCISLY